MGPSEYVLPDFNVDVLHQLFIDRYAMEEGRSQWDLEEIRTGWNMVEDVEWTSILRGRSVTSIPLEEAWEVIRANTGNKTSPGWPYTLLYNNKDSVPKSFIIQKALELKACLLNGKNPVVFQLFQKDELVKLKKLQDKKQRAICCVPYDALLLQVSTSQNWHRISHRACVRGPYVVGINPFSLEWSFIAMRHAKFKHHIALDISGFEFTVNSEDFRCLGELRASIHDPSDAEGIALIRALHRLKDDKIVRDQCGCWVSVGGGNPSGQGDTTEDNCRIALRYVYSALDVMCERFGIAFDPRTDCEISIYGDDVVLSVSDRLGALFTPAELRDFYLARNIVLKCTDRWCPLRDVDLLSHRFQPFGDFYYVPAPTRGSKLRKSFAVYPKGMSVEARLQRLIQLQYMVTFDDELWALFEEGIAFFIKENVDAITDEKAWTVALRSKRARGALIRSVLAQECAPLSRHDLPAEAVVKIILDQGLECA